MSAGDVYFEQFLVTTPKSGGLHDALPSIGAQSFLVVGFHSITDPAADLGLVRFDSSNYFGIEAISSIAQVKSDTGVKIITTGGDIEITPFGSALISGGYGSSGVTISNAGALSMNGALVVDGQATFGGGYGSTGVTIATTGNISTNGSVVADGTISVAGGYGSSGASVDASGNLSMNGSLIIDGTMSKVELTTPATKSVMTLFTGYSDNEMVFSTGTTPTFSQQSATHAASGRSVRKGNGWVFTAGSGTGHFQFRTPSGATITDIKLLVVELGDGTHNGEWTAHVYSIGNVANVVDGDEGLEYQFGSTVSNIGSGLILPGKFGEVSLNGDASWDDFTSSGALYLDIGFATSAGSPTTGQRSLAGVIVVLSFAEMEDVPS
jgi:hypothetical protein